jgi:hypothetical protein
MNNNLVWRFDQEISRNFDFGNRLDWNIDFSFDPGGPGSRKVLELIMLNIGLSK